MLDCLVANVIGRGITVEPQVKDQNGELSVPVNQKLSELWEEWVRYPEVTWECHWNHMLRLLARHLFRDGEVFIKHIEGTANGLDHGTIVPYSLELIEADYLPFDYNDEKETDHSRRREKWLGTCQAYYLYKDHPGDSHKILTRKDVKRIYSDKIIHLKFTKRLSQTRGVSLFANVLTRLEDIKDYELSERLAAKVAASICAYIRKSLDAPTGNMTLDDKGDRLMKMQPGMIFDNLMPGEEVGMIDSNRPNTMLEQFRNSQLKGCSSWNQYQLFIDIKDYNGTYSAQRQELVEQSGALCGVLRIFH